MDRAPALTPPRQLPSQKRRPPRRRERNLAVDDNQFDRVTEEVLALNAAIVAKGGLEKAFEGPIALGAAVEKAQDDQSPGGEYAART
jgi:hypothetical protein